jgi:mannose-6-phosphate isomerase-like protein (cupin superfamily)
MARKNQIIENATTGEKIQFLQTAADTNGSLLQLECWIEPGGGLKIPPHMHPFQDQRFDIKAGRVKFNVGNSPERILESGDQITVPQGIFYNWRAIGNDPLDFVAEYRPAGHWEDLFESTFELARQHREGKRINMLVATAVMMTAFPDHLVIAGPPRFAQKLMFRLLAIIGKWQGYKPSYEYQG